MHNVYYIVLASFEGVSLLHCLQCEWGRLGVTLHEVDINVVAACDAWVDNGIPLSIFGHSLLLNSLLYYCNIRHQKKERMPCGAAVSVLLFLLWSLVEVHSQTPPAPYLTFMGETLPDHAFVNLSLVGDALDGSDSVQCRTDRSSCCSGAQGADRGDWYFPSGDRLGFSYYFGAYRDIYEQRLSQGVDLRRRIHADIPSGIYRCDIPTIANDHDDYYDRESVYAGLYASGGKK